MLEGRTQPTRAYILYTIFLFCTIFLLINYSLRDPNYILPRIFLYSQPHFPTHICDPISRLTLQLTFVTHISRLHSRLMFATHVHDSTSDSHSRLTSATPLVTHVRDSQSRPQPRLTVFCDFPSCDSTTDGQTVLTPQRHLPSVPTLTLTK